MQSMQNLKLINTVYPKGKGEVKKWEKFQQHLS